MGLRRAPAGARGGRGAAEGGYCATIKRAEQKITTLYNRYLERAGITRGQYALLVNIQNHPGISVSGLAERMNLERATLERNLRPLGRRRRNRDAAQSGRSRSLELTEEGKEILETAVSLWQQAQQEFERQMGKERAQLLLQLLEEIISL